MARKPVVSRTLTSTVATLLCANTRTEETFRKELRISRSFRRDPQLIRAANILINDPDVRIVVVLNKKVSTDLYVMSEEKFMECAEQVLPARTRKNEKGEKQ